MKFSKAKYVAYLVDHGQLNPEASLPAWVDNCDGKPAVPEEFYKNPGLEDAFDGIYDVWVDGLSHPCVVLKEWCE